MDIDIIENTERTEVYNDDHYEETTEENSSDDYIWFKTDSESSGVLEVIDAPEAAASNVSYNIAVLFVLSMIAGLLVFSCLSRRWNT